MEIWVDIYQSIFKVVIVGAIAFGGIILGRIIRKKVDEKKHKDIN